MDRCRKARRPLFVPADMNCTSHRHKMERRIQPIATDDSSITFFKPLQEDSVLTQSSVFQSVLSLFTSVKNAGAARSSSTPHLQNDTTDVDDVSWRSKDACNSNKSESEINQVTGDDVENEASHTYLTNEKSLTRPGSLRIKSVSKRKEIVHGSEVEVRLRHFSSVFQNLPRLISGTHQQMKESQLLQPTSDSNLRQFWMPDEHCHQCYDCGDRFTTFRRRHHCRICGHIFCKRCCYQLIPGQFVGYSGMLRSCTYCYNLLSQAHRFSVLNKANNATSFTSEHEGFHDSVQDLYGPDASEQLHAIPSTRLQMNSEKSKSMVSMNISPNGESSKLFSPGTPYFLQEGGALASRYDVFDVTQEDVYDDDEEVDDLNEFCTDPEQIHELWGKIVDDKDGLEFRDHRFRLRKYALTVTGAELVDWLLANKIVATRQQARAIGQALIDMQHIRSVFDDRVFHDAYCLYQRGQTDSPGHDPVHFNVPPGATSTPHVKIRLPQGSRRSIDETFSLDTEPKWVREICNDDENDLSQVNKDESARLWPDGVSNRRSSSTPSELFASDEESIISSVSGQSVSSYVEIDSDQNVIKYKRPSAHASRFGGKSAFSPQHSELTGRRFVDKCLTEISGDYLRNYLTWNGTYLANLRGIGKSVWPERGMHSSPSSPHEKQIFSTLQKIYFRHSVLFLNQLFKTELLEPSWAGVLVPLVRYICDTVITHSETSMNICHYVHVKRLLDGDPHESHVVNGVVFTKSVVHNQMKSCIENPLIMLVDTPLEYQRIHHKLSSLEPIVQQETEFYKNLVSRILKRNPDVVISQCSVSHKARQLLGDAGIALVINVKESVMERLSRCTGADVARSIDQLQTVQLGSCSRFRVSKHYNGQRTFNCSDGILADQSDGLVDGTKTNSSKSLMYLEGCNPSCGCTVILRDSPSYHHQEDADSRSRSRLSRLKDVFQFLLKIVYHGKLELSYLMDQENIAGSARVLTKKDKKARTAVDESEKDESQDNAGNGSSTFTSKLLPNQSSDQIASHSDPPALPSNNCSASDTRCANCDDSRNVSNDCAQSQELAASKDGSESDGTFYSHIQKTLMSVSPFIEPQLPYLLSSKGRASPLRRYLPSTLFWSDAFCADNVPTRKKHIRHRTVSTDDLDAVENGDYVPTESRQEMPSDAHQKMWKKDRYDGSSEIKPATASVSDQTVLSDAKESSNKAMSGPVERVESLKESSKAAPSFILCRGLSLPSKNYITKDDVCLSAWEQSTMQEALSGQSVNESSLSPFKHRKDSEEVFDWGKRETKVWMPQKHAFVSSSLSKPADSKEMRDLLADFRACGSALCDAKKDDKAKSHTNKDDARRAAEPSPAAKQSIERKTPGEPLSGNGGSKISERPENFLPLDCFSPKNHQHIYVLFSSYSSRSPNAPYPCVKPWAVDIDFYHGNDITLGGFLERYCFRPSYHCTNPTCKRPMIEHVRSFVHGTSCLNIVLKELSKPVPVPYILSWCWNPQTESSTDLKPLSRDAWSMSFAKFLEIRLQRSRPQHRYTNYSGVSFETFNSFQFFLLRDIVAAFKCFEISVFDIALPPATLKFLDCTTWRKGGENDNGKPAYYPQLVGEMNALSKLSYEAMDSIYDMVVLAKARCPFDQTSSDQSDAGVDNTALNQMREVYFDELLTLYQEERSYLRDCVDKLHLKLQSFRIKTCVKESTKAATPESASQARLNIQDTDESSQYSLNLEDVQVSVADHSSLTAELLELTCLLSNLVNVWNSRISSVLEQDRASKKSGKASNLYYVSQSYNADRKVFVKSTEHSPQARKPEPQNSLHEAEEKPSNCDATDGEIFVVDGLDPGHQSAFASNISSRLGTSSEGGSPSRRESCATVDGGTSTGGDSTSHRPNYEKQSSVSRLTRTASSMSTFFANHLLATSTFVQVKPVFPLEEHYLLPNCVNSKVVVRDSEPSSIIAYALHCPEYKQFLSRDLLTSAAASSQDERESRGSERISSSGSNAVDFDSGVEPMCLSDGRDPFWIEFKGAAHPKQEELKKSSPLRVPPSNAVNSSHTEIQFSDPTTKFYCKVYFAREFLALRKEILEDSEESYLASLSRCVRWAARGGKSGSAFHKTIDDRLVLKQMSRFDHHSFMELAPRYFAYITEAARNKSPTALSKVLGVYRISFHNTRTGRSFKQDVLVMENLFYKRNILQVYDLKGSVRNRHVKTDVTGNQSHPKNASPVGSSGNDAKTDVNKNNLVLMDENLLTIMKDRPLYVREHAKFLIKQALTADSNFLSSHQIIDYSLLVGVDEERKEIVVGIIDYMRTFTWDKKLEMYVKSAGMASRLSARAMPTVVSPEQYRSRFCEAMDRYFQVAPDRWYEMPTYRTFAAK